MEENQDICERERQDGEKHSQGTHENENNVENEEQISNDDFLNVEELIQEAKRTFKSPGTYRRLSGSGSKYAVIQYLSNVAKNRSAMESFDFTFVEYLLDNGVDINESDIIGQSAFHIVAKFWSIDVAIFLLDHGGNINAQDFLERSPLHEAAGLDYVDMVEFLLQNGADLDSETSDQNQKPIHYAAKNNSCQSLSILLAYGADINSLDMKMRTPLQVAAEMNRSKATVLLIQEGASAAIYDDEGNSALTLLTEKIPDIALLALNQLYFVDDLNNKGYFSLNKLEAPRIEDRKVNVARTLLEVAVQNRRFAIVTHPVVQRLIDVKWENFGKRAAICEIMFNLVYITLWSIISIVLSYSSHDMYLPMASRGWRLAIVIAIIIITAGVLTKQISGMVRVRRQRKQWVELRANALVYSHPRYTDEWEFLSNEAKSVRNHSYLSTEESGVYIDCLTLFLVIAAIISHVIFLKHDTMAAYKVHRGVLIALLLVLWTRMARFARPFRSTGPIVVIFTKILEHIIKCAFLFAVLFIPYACAFWVTYGSNAPSPVQGYSNFSDLLYNLLCMVVGVDFPFNELLLADPFMARILCSSFIISTTIVVVNVLIALLSDTFTRLYSNAVANAIMQRAQCILVTERSLGKKRKQEYYKYMRENCNPYVVSMDRESTSKNKRGKTSADKNKIAEELKQVNIAIRRLSGKSSPIQLENRKKEENVSINYMMRQLLEQSRENTDKINKMYSRIMERKELEESDAFMRRHFIRTSTTKVRV